MYRCQVTCGDFGAGAFGMVMCECVGQGYIRRISVRVVGGIHTADDGGRYGFHGGSAAYGDRHHRERRLADCREH